MASDINFVTLEGRLGHDPQVRKTSAGTSVCNLRVAHKKTTTSKATGEKTETTKWYNVTLWGKLADIGGQYLEKGTHVLFTGSWDKKDDRNKNGEDIERDELTAVTMRMLGGGRAKSDSTERRVDPGQRDQRQSAGALTDYDDDIPF